MARFYASRAGWWSGRNVHTGDHVARVPTEEKELNTFLWILAAVLALAFAMSGSMKLFTSIESLREKMDWTSDFSHRAIKSIGALEIVGALGLILPPLFGVAEILTPLAAVGLVIVMLGAMAVHARRGGEGQMIMINIVLAALAAILAWGRFGPEPF